MEIPMRWLLTMELRLIHEEQVPMFWLTLQSLDLPSHYTYVHAQTVDEIFQVLIRAWLQRYAQEQPRL